MVLIPIESSLQCVMSQVDDLSNGVEISGLVELDVEIVGRCLQKFCGLRLHNSVRNRNRLYVFNRQMCELRDEVGFVVDDFIGNCRWRRCDRQVTDSALECG